MVINSHRYVIMTRYEVEMFLSRLMQERMLQESMLEENGGEMTESVLTQQEIIDNLAEAFESDGGIDAVGRYVKQSQDSIAARKAEKEYAERHLRAEENNLATFLECVDYALQKSQKDKVKGQYGYSFTQHTSVSTKPDNKVIKELFFDKVEKVIRDSGVVPDDITFSLSASATRLAEGAKKPEWYNTTSVGKAVFRKPRKSQIEEGNEFNVTDFCNALRPQESFGS